MEVSLGDVIHSPSFKYHLEPGDSQVLSPTWIASLNSDL